MQLAAEVAPAPASASEALQGTSQVVGAQPSPSAAATAGAAAGNATVAPHKAQDVVRSSHRSSHRSSKRRALLHAPVLVMGLLLLALLTATAAARPGLYRRMSASANSSDTQGTTGVGDWWGRAPISAGGHVQATAVRSRQVPFSRHLLQTQWGLLGLRTNRLSGGILQQLLTAATEEDTAAANAAKEAASAQGRASRLLLTDLDPSTGGEGPPRVLATAAQGPSGPVGTAGQALLPIGTDAQPLCSATINYGASVGDASKKATADVPIYVGSFDVVVTQPQNFQPDTPLPEGQSRWVLGWQFAAGEYLQMTRDVFGDDGIQRVFMSPSLQPPPEGTEAASALLPNKGNLGQAGNAGQRVAVFSNTSLGGSNAEVVFSFVGRKGPERPILPSAPFRVAPPERIFLNNHYCWPFFKPQGSGGSSPAAVAAAVGSGAAVGLGSSTPAAGQPDQQVQMVEVATPKLEPDNMPKQLQVEYLPVEFASKGDDPALFAKTVTQFYFKITNLGTAPVPLEEVLLQYWFHGPLDGTATAPDNSSAQAAGVTSELQAQAARVSASQFRLTCSDASPQIGCGGLAWNVTPGLPSAFGARYVLNVWFPSAVSNSSDNMQPFALLPTGNNSTAGNSIAGQQGLTDMQAIVAIEPRRFFANISATNDYSFSDTPVLGPQPGANSSSGGDSGQLVRRRREPNPRMPAYIADQLAWGSPPVGGRLEPRIASGNSTAGNRSTYPPGSYCQPSPGGGLVCGIDVLYCCLGSGPLNLAAVPPDWPNRLASGTNPAIAPNDTVGNLTEGLGGAGDLNSSGNKSGLDTWAVALAVVLPIVAVIAAAVGGGTAYVRRRRRSSAAAALQFKPFNDSSNNGSTDGGDVLTELQRPPGPGGLQRPAGWAAVGGVGTAGSSSNPSLLAALLSQHSSQGASTAGWSSAGMQQQQQLAEWQLTHAQQVPDMASSHRSQSPPQVHYSTAMSAAAAAAAANPQQQQLVRVLKPKVPSLPGDMIAAVAKFAKQQHLRQQSSSRRSSGNQDRPGSPFASASWVPFAGAAGLSQAVEDVDGQDGRCHTWTGRLHEDAFEDDVLDQLFNMHMRPQLMHAATPGSPPATTDKVWHQLQQQQHPLSPNNGAGAAAAAVEAAVAAINALLSGTVGLPRQPSPALSKYPPGRGRGSNASSGSGTRPNSSGQMVERSGSSSSPSFYKALMATGGVLRPPGGPPIPLNVDYAAEIQPNLGRLLGRGGFGHVYEATWRGQKVAVKLLTVDTEDPAVLDAFLKEVALCACLRGCDRVVRLLGACLGGCGTPPHANQSHPPPSKAGGATVAGSSFQTSSTTSMSAAAAASVSLDNTSVDITPFQSQLPPDVAADDTPPGSNAGGQQQQQQWALIMELVEGGNLAHRIYHPSKRSLSYLEILQVGLDIASGLAYLHPAVVHRDLKPQNVLLDKHGRAKIADFGISRFKDPHRSYLSVTHQGGTPNYMAPELFNASRVDEAADVYSLGCILYECLAKQQPFGHLADEGKSFNVLFKIIVAVAINKERPPLPHDTPPRLAALILRCWCENPAGRPHVRQLLAELEDMMKEALQERAERTGKLARINSISSRSHSLPTQSLHHRKDSTGSIISNASSANGSSSPIRPGHAVRAALTLPMPGPPHNSLASSLAAVSDGSASFGMWPLPATGSGSYHGSGLPRHNGSGTALAVPGGVVPLPSIGAAIAARASARAPGRGRRSSDDTSTTPAAASDVSQGCSLQLQTGAAARLPAYAAGQGSSDSGVDGTDLPSPRPFQDQQLLTLQQEQEQQQQQQQFAHQQQQQQLLGPCTSLASSMYSRRHWQCPCFGSPEPCAACAGSTSSSDGGSSNGGGCGSSGGSHRTPSSTSPLHMSPTGGRQLSLLPQIPQDMPALPAEDVSAPSAAATAGGEPVVDKYAAAPAAAATGMQMSSLQAPLLRSKASIASPQTPARNAHVGRKPSHLSSHASGALFSSEGSIPIGVGALAAHHHQQQQQQLAAPGSSDNMYAPPAAAATAYSALLYPLHTDNIAAATAAAFGSQPAAMLQRDAGVGGSSYNHGVATLASATPAAAAGLSGQRSVGHSRSSSSTSSNGSAGSVVLKRLHNSHPDTAANTTVAAAAPEVDAEQQGQHSEQEPLQRLQQQWQSSMQQHDSRRYSSSLLQRRAHDQSQQQQQQQRAGSLRPSSSLPPSLARSTSSIPSEAPQAGELSSSQSSSPSAVTASMAAASVYSCSSGTSRLRSASLDFGSTSLYINPLFGLAADAWQPPQLQMQHSAPSMGRAGSASGRSAALLAIGQAAPVAEAAAAALQTGSQHHLRESAESGSDNTMFVTAKSYAASAAAGSVDLGPGPAGRQHWGLQLAWHCKCHQQFQDGMCIF